MTPPTDATATGLNEAIAAIIAPHVARYINDHEKHRHSALWADSLTMQKVERILALIPSASVGGEREAELIAQNEQLRSDIRHIQRNTATYRQEARKKADAATQRAAEANKRADNMAEANRRMLAMFEADPTSLATVAAANDEGVE